MEVAKQKNTTQKPEQLEDDKPDYQEKITFLISTVAQGFILAWCLLVLSLGYVKLTNKLFGVDIPDSKNVNPGITLIMSDNTFETACLIT